MRTLLSALALKLHLSRRRVQRGRVIAVEGGFFCYTGKYPTLADLWRDEGATFNDAYDLKPDAPAGPSGADGPGEPEGDAK